jgi:hypothetical protein
VCTGNENSKPIWNKFIIRKDSIETSQVVLNFCRSVYDQNWCFNCMKITYYHFKRTLFPFLSISSEIEQNDIYMCIYITKKKVFKIKGTWDSHDYLVVWTINYIMCSYHLDSPTWLVKRMTQDFEIEIYMSMKYTTIQSSPLPGITFVRHEK